MNEDKNMNQLPSAWTTCTFNDLLDYIQPTNYIVESTEYKDDYKIPVLTAGKSFIKGYTNETTGIFDVLPVIIFDDFTTATKFVNFPFKVKSSAMKILSPKSPLVNIKYVFYLMQTIHASIDTHKRYWISEYSKLKIPLAPFNEQESIVSKIEELFSDLDNGIENLNHSLKQLKIYRQTLLIKAFAGKFTEEWRQNQKQLLTSKAFISAVTKQRELVYYQKLETWNRVKRNSEKEKSAKPKKPSNLDPKNDLYLGLVEKGGLPNEWEIVPLVFVSDNEPNSIVDGPFGSSINVNEDYIDTGIPVIRMVNIRPFMFVQDQMKFIKKSKFQSLRRHNILPGDILIAKVGATIGDCCIYPNNQPEAMLSTTGSCRVRLDRNVMEGKFLEYYVYFHRNTLKQIASQTAQPFLNMKVLKSFPIVLPIIEEQQKIIHALESRFSIVEKLEESITKSLQQAKTLRQSILEKAFEGKLVQSIESEETASELLERIKEESERRKAGKPTHIKQIKMAKELKTIIELLKESKQPVAAKALWQSSIHSNNIEAFYAQLKELIEKGEIKEMPRKGKESFLTITPQK